MKGLLVTIGIILICITLLVGCGAPKTTTSQPTSVPPTTVQPTTAPSTAAQAKTVQPTTTQPTTAQPTSIKPSASPSPSASPTGGPVSGGTLRIITASGPRVLGYSLEQGPMDLYDLLAVNEKVVEYDDQQVLIPHLAKSVNFDYNKKTITVKLRSGIKFHDGSECNADAIVWNYQQQVSNKRIGYIDQWKSIDIVDNLTFAITYTGSFNNQFLMGWLWSPPMFSKQAFINAGGGDQQKSIEWARTNDSGTGPFKLAEYKRDDHMTLTRFDDYWGGKPYLDALNYIFIPDLVTASTMMQAKQADMWLGPPVSVQSDLEKKGLVRKSGGGMFSTLVPNIVDPKSKWNNAKLRQAVEYALDKTAMAKALGFGYYQPMTMISPPGSWGYDPNYPARNYDPQKAKATLADAGYPNGLRINLLALQGNEDTATAIKRYLDAVGITTNIDIADAGRYYGSLYVTGWQDLILSGAGILGDFLGTFQTNYSDQPLTRMKSWAADPDLTALCVDSRTYPDQAGQKAATAKIVKYMTDQALIIPLFLAPSAYIIQPYVHTTYLQQGGFTFYFKDYWMDKH
jgi:peptide/nickel transport system substrate-binding protein